jgi:glycosyltransferase involved in cell wall biosynthesis
MGKKKNLSKSIKPPKSKAKIALYSICRDEAKHVERWYKSTQQADHHILVDTGSTDDTIEIAKSLGITVYQIHIEPWRFDDARNASLALVPKDVDYCVAMDLDEIMLPGWYEALQRAHRDGTDRPEYRFITAWDADGNPVTEFNGFRIHRRNRMRWIYPIHEVLECYEGTETRKLYRFESHHLPDNDKPRNYLELLQKAVEQNPDARNLYYLAREYFGHKHFEQAKETLERYLAVSEFPAEKSFAMRMMAKCDLSNEEEWLLQAMETFASRESILALANYYYVNQRWAECHLVALRALQATDRNTGFLSEQWAWGHMAYDLIAVSAWRLGKYQEAYEYGKKAVQIAPDNEQLRNNLEIFKEKIDGNLQRSGNERKE